MASVNSRVPGVLHFDVTINDKNEESTISMLISHIKKSWNSTDLKKKVYDSGITNRLLGFYVNNDPNTKVSAQCAALGRSDIVLVRIYGAKTELIIDRAQELINMQELSQHGIAPPLYCTFNNGYCYKYIEGRVLEVEDMPKPAIYTLIAKKMAQLHSIKLSDHFLKNHNMESKLFDILHRYINLIPKEFKDAAKQKRYEEAVPSLESLRGEVETLSEAISNLKNKPNISFSHNDLLIANFIHDEYQDEIYFIDHEYGCPNFSTYDIGNHFNEWAGVETVDYTLYPSKETQLKWLQIYLDELKTLKGISEEKTGANELENMYVVVQKFSLASNFFWGVWGLIQAHYSEIDFDYLEYAIVRLNEYFKNKDNFLAMKEV